MHAPLNHSYIHISLTSTSSLPPLLPILPRYYGYLWSEVVAHDILSEFTDTSLATPEGTQRLVEVGGRYVTIREEETWE